MSCISIRTWPFPRLVFRISVARGSSLQGSGAKKINCCLQLTRLLVRHPERVPLEGDAATAALGGRRVHPQEERRVGREPSGQQPGTPSRDVDQQLMLRVGEDLHVEVLLQPRTEALAALHLQTVLRLVREAAILGWIGGT